LERLNKTILGLAVLALGGAAIWYFASLPGPKPAPPATVLPAPLPPPEPAAPATAETVARPVPKTEGLPAEQLLRFPNGTAVAPLNKVIKPAVCAWGDTPWSPIVRCEFNNGLDWYVHADGTYTTTLMTWRSDLGREEPFTLCLHPVTPVGIEPGAAGGPDVKPKR